MSVGGKETDGDEDGRALPPTAALGLALLKVRADTKAENAIWARRLRYVRRQKGLSDSAWLSRGHLLLVRVSGRGDPPMPPPHTHTHTLQQNLQNQQDSSIISA